jgi:hypothetical protein
MQRIKKLELIRPFFIPQRILPPKEYKVNKELVTMRNNKGNCRSFLSLEVEPRNLYKETDFL